MSVIRKTYEEFLKMGKEAVEAVQIPFKVRDARLKLESEINQIEQKIAEADLAIEKAKSIHPLNVKSILAALNAKALLERELAQTNELKEEMFPG